MVSESSACVGHMVLVVIRVVAWNLLLIAAVLVVVVRVASDATGFVFVHSALRWSRTKVVGWVPGVTLLLLLLLLWS